MPKDDFPAVSDVRRDAGRPGIEWDETLYELSDDREWRGGKWGDDIGTVHLKRDGDDVEASFSFHAGRKVTYRGPVPGRGSGKGRSTFEYVAGDKRGRDKLETDWNNPKRWG